MQYSTWTIRLLIIATLYTVCRPTKSKVSGNWTLRVNPELLFRIGKPTMYITYSYYSSVIVSYYNGVLSDGTRSTVSTKHHCKVSLIYNRHTLRPLAISTCSYTKHTNADRRKRRQLQQCHVQYTHA